MGRVIVCGSCVVDLPCLPVDLDSAPGGGRTHPIEPIEPRCGGITCNVGIALKRVGMDVGILSLVGDDLWGQFVRERLQAEGVAHDLLGTHPSAPTTAVAVLVDGSGERSFLAPGVRTATKSIDAEFLRSRLTEIASADWFVLGYFGRMPGLEPNLPDVLAEIRARGVRTVMDAAGDGGDWGILSRALPHLDVFVPSLAEARGHLGGGLGEGQCELRPEEMLDRYREAGARGIVGVKLGARGAVLADFREGAGGSRGGGEQDWVEIRPVQPPGKVIDSTGAGDAFVAGLVAGLDQGMGLAEAGHAAATAGANATTQKGSGI